MNALRLSLAGLLVVLAVGSLAHAKEEKKDTAKMIVGTWEITKSYDNGPPVGATVEFGKDGKFMLSGKAGDKDISHGGTYKVDGEKVNLVLKNEDKETKMVLTVKKISDTEMTTENESGKMVELKRKK